MHSVAAKARRHALSGSQGATLAVGFDGGVPQGDSASKYVVHRCVRQGVLGTQRRRQSLVRGRDEGACGCGETYFCDGSGQGRMFLAHCTV